MRPVLSSTVPCAPNDTVRKREGEKGKEGRVPSKPDAASRFSPVGWCGSACVRGSGGGGGAAIVSGTAG
jgi:hypothetical protein